MARQKFFRCSAAIVEQPNGLYSVAMHTRFEHGDQDDTQRYADLNWGEACQVMFDMMDTWGTERLRHLQSVLGDPWIQLSFDNELSASQVPSP